MKTIVIDPNQKQIVVEEDTKFILPFVGEDEQEVSSSIEFVHEKSRISSNVIVKAVLFDKSSFNLNGKIVVKTGAKEVDSFLKIDILLVSKEAKATASPNLEIMEDEVKAGHSMTIGSINEEEIYYLMSRGIPRAECERIIAESFFEEIIADCPKNLIDRFNSKIRKIYK